MTNIFEYIFGDLNMVYVKEGVIYLPLVVDKKIKNEMGYDKSKIASVKGRNYIQSIRIESIIDNYDKINTTDYESFKKSLLKVCPKEILHDLDEEKRTIIFEVMPYFIKRKDKTKKMSRKDILEILAENLDIPKEYYERAENLSKKNIKNTISTLKNKIEDYSLPEGEIEVSELRDLLNGLIKNKILIDEVNNLEKKLLEKEKSEDKNCEEAVLLYLSENTLNFEIGDFGVKDDWIYLKVGEYALRDFDGKVYRFPPCKVGVTYDSSSPFVLDKYKHPFLKSHEKEQKICIGNQSIGGETEAEAIIRGLEIGVNTLLYGYFGSLKPYHTLDGKVHHGSYEIEFNDYLISNNHPDIKSGKLRITNDISMRQKNGNDS